MEGDSAGRRSPELDKRMTQERAQGKRIQATRCFFIFGTNEQTNLWLSLSHVAGEKLPTRTGVPNMPTWQADDSLEVTRARDFVFGGKRRDGTSRVAWLRFPAVGRNVQVDDLAVDAGTAPNLLQKHKTGLRDVQPHTSWMPRKLKRILK